jgi:PKD repeat protein
MRRFVAGMACSALVVGLVLAVNTHNAQAAAVTSVPRPDHIVIVLEENRAEQNILGNPDAPFINSLAASGANMTSFFAETHPSQPNYLALFSGSTQGVTDDSCPHAFATANLGAQVIGAGLDFTGYSESLPSVGYTGCTSGRYARKHNPWVNFTSVPASANQPFTAFPTDYSTLPQVSFVIPNLDNDMHDGTIAQGDTWLQNNLGGYITWAQTHNSVFALTFDEDDHSQSNQIPTILTGQRIQQSAYTETVNHYNLLRTIEDAFGLPGIGASASASPLLDIWAAPVGNQAPVAAFSSSCSGLGCTLNGSGSVDPDGSISSYAWVFGDSQTGSGVTPSHTYASDGTYSVRLTVTDDQGATDSVTHQVSVSAGGGAVSFVGAAHGPPGSVKIQQLTVPASVTAGDTMVLVFTRATTVAWTGPGGVSGWNQLDSFDNAGVTSTVWRKTASGADAGTSVQFTSGTFSKGVLELVVYRNVATGAAVLAHSGDSTQTAHTTPTVSAPAGARVLSVWSDKSSGTTVWTAPGTVTTRDTAIGTGDGRYGVLVADSGGPVNAGSYGNLTATTDATSNRGDMWTIALPAAGPPPNSPPVAAFSSSCTARSCSFDGSGSADPDGSINSYAWTFGDSGVGSGVAPAHGYATDGTYSVTLTVTDNQGATGSVTHQLSVAAGGGGGSVSFVAAAHGPGGSVKIEQLTVPASVNAGDTMLLMFTRATAVAWTGPAGVTGWTQLDSFDNSSVTSTVWQKTAASSDAGAVLRFTSASFSKGVLELVVYRGASNAAPVLAHSADSGQAVHVTPTISAPASATVVSLWSDKSTATSSWSAPVSVTTRDTAIGTGDGRYGALVADSGGPVTGGTYGNLTATADAVGTRGAMWTIALSPGN